MASWVAEISPVSVLDPAAGAGALLAQVDGNVERLQAAEPDPVLRRVLRERFPRLELLSDARDYLNGERFPAVTMNPPFIAHSRLADKALWHELVAERGLDLPRTSNLAVIMMLLFARSLEPAGRLAALVPTEVLQTAGAGPARQALLSSGLRSVADLEDRGLFGSTVASTACLLLFEEGYDGPVSFGAGTPESLQDWPAFEGRARRIDRQGLDPSARWRPPDPVRRSTPGSLGLIPLSDLVSVRPGTITGSNAFFLVSREEAERAGLTEYLRHCLVRPHQLPTPFVHPVHAAEAATDRSRRHWLLVIPPEPSDSAMRHLEEHGGEVRLRATARARSPWWSQEKPSQMHLAVGNFRRGDYLVCGFWDQGLVPVTWAAIPNRLALPEGEQHLLSPLHALLCSARGQSCLRANERHAGSGLYTLRSGALKQVMVPDLRRLPDWRLAQIADLNDQRLGYALSGNSAEAQARQDELDALLSSC